MVAAENQTEAAILSRRSIRGFLPTPIPRATVEHLLDVAARAPSGTNMQPWRVLALAGAPLASFTSGLVTAARSGETDGPESAYYPAPLFEPYVSRRRKIGWDLYGLLGIGIGRGERDKARAHVEHSLRFFGAPVGLLLLAERRLAIGSWLDLGMFLQTLAVAARARGLDTCPMAVFAEHPRAIRRLLGVAEQDQIICGMAIGYEDAASPANALRTDRVPAASFSEFRGF
ncbi:MAG: nitroreductase [Rhodospirillales bacterium]|nr:nitroreductase [Rhodospirillales bacterium]